MARIALLRKVPLFSSLDFNFQRSKLPAIIPDICSVCLEAKWHGLNNKLAKHTAEFLLHRISVFVRG